MRKKHSNSIDICGIGNKKFTTLRKWNNSYTKYKIENGFPTLIDFDAHVYADLMASEFGYERAEVKATAKKLSIDNINIFHKNAHERVIRSVEVCKSIVDNFLINQNIYTTNNINIKVDLGLPINAYAYSTSDCGEAEVSINYGIGYLHEYFCLYYSTHGIAGLNEKKPSEDQYLELYVLARECFGFGPGQILHFFIPPDSYEAITPLSELMHAKLTTIRSMLFIILHEIGHVVLGHVSEHNSWKADEALTTDELKERRAIERKWEYDADYFAFRALAGQFKKDTRYPILGSMLPVESMYPFFRVATFVDNSEENNSEQTLRQHPYPSERSSRLFKNARDLINRYFINDEEWIEKTKHNEKVFEKNVLFSAIFNVWGHDWFKDDSSNLTEKY